ncbi:MAG: hypothetical protein C0467_31925 [Planctomycetaceae bacterium]|nr:hypothetical protein [Planctomycetaceae bacterium]
MNQYRITAGAVLLATLILTGCNGNKATPHTNAATGPSKAEEAKPDEVAVERTKLSPADRALVEAQEWCVVSTEERLGSMGPPVKLEVKGRSVFICCKGCKSKAEADPEQTLAKVEELKAKAKMTLKK